ncbi:unnamed protein product, partial [Natator depressus]
DALCSCSFNFCDFSVELKFYVWFLVSPLFLNNINISKFLKESNVFKVPALRKKPVPEEKVPVAVPKKEVAPPVKVPEVHKRAVQEEKVTVAVPKKKEPPPAKANIFKVPEVPERVVPEEKVPTVIPRKEEAPPYE